MSTDNDHNGGHESARSAHQDQTRRLVGAMMKLTGRSATGLARAAGLTPSTINRFMHQQVRHTLSQRTMLALMTDTFLTIKNQTRSSLDPKALAELAPAIAVYERGILERAPDVATILVEAKAAASAHGDLNHEAAVADLPVLMGSTGAISIPAGDFSQAPLRTRRPSFLESDPRAFAILMPDATMVPRFDVGDILYVSPARNLEGEKVDVVLERSNGGFVIGSLAGLTAASVRVATLSSRARATFDRTKLRGIYRIVGVQRLGG